MLSKCLQMQAVTSIPSTGRRSSCSLFATLLISIRLGWSAVHWAAGAGHTKCIEALVIAGANVSIRASDGTCALHWAAQRGHADCIQALLASAADVNVVDRCIALLSHFHAYSHRSHVCVFGHDSDLYRSNGRTPLHHAVARFCPSEYSGNEPIPVAEFVDMRFDLEQARGFDGLIACVHKLVNAGADVNIRDRYYE
jgi:hypothetical protein